MEIITYIRIRRFEISTELATVNTTYTSDTGKSYDFNTATKLNSLGRIDAKAFGLEKCSRIKAFVFKFFASKAA